MEVRSSWTAAAFLGIAGVHFPEQLLPGAHTFVNPLQNTSSNLVIQAVVGGVTSPEGSFRVAVTVSCGSAQLLLQYHLPTEARHRLPSRVVAAWVSL